MTRPQIKMRQNKRKWLACAWVTCLAAMTLLGACKGSDGKDGVKTYVDANGHQVEKGNAEGVEALPFSGDEAAEQVYDVFGKHTIRLVKDKSISHPEKMKNRDNCFVVMSKKDYYLYVYEPQGDDTVMLARYDCCFSLKKGDKEAEGDMRTPNCTMDNPFVITEIKDASGWEHDFGDGRGSILSYGHYFHRLDAHGHSGIGIHGSTNNEESVPGRASEGCIRLLDADIIDFRENYAQEGMSVVIKAEDVDDLPFEIHAMKKQNIQRKRHLDPSKTLTNEQVEQATPKQP